MVVTILCMLAYSRDTSVGLSDDKFTVAFFFKFKHSLNSWSSQLKSISFGSFFSVPTWYYYSAPANIPSSFRSSIDRFHSIDLDNKVRVQSSWLLQELS